MMCVGEEEGLPVESSLQNTTRYKLLTGLYCHVVFLIFNLDRLNNTGIVQVSNLGKYYKEKSHLKPSINVSSFSFAYIKW